MSNGDRTRLTLAERLALAERSQASSPEAAAALVRRFAGLHTAVLLAGSADSDLMYELTGEYWNLLEGLLHYGGFCCCFLMALRDDFVPPASPERPPDPFRPVWGTRVNNAVILLGLMLLDHAKGRRRDKAIYRCTRMTLEQYLDALEALAFPAEDPPGLSFRSWREGLLQRHDGSAPLGDVLADILRRYIAGWQEFDHLDHILRCMGALACYLEDVSTEPLLREEAERLRAFREALRQYAPGLDSWSLVEADKRYLNPGGYYFGLANEYPEDVPDPGDAAVPARAVRSRIYLSGRDYHPAALRALAALSPSPDLGALLMKYSGPGRLSAAMAEIHVAVSDLYMLWVEPYLAMEEHRCEERPEEGPLLV